MMHVILRWPLVLAPLILIGGCLSMGTQPPAQPGGNRSDTYTLTEGRAESRSGCEFDYRVYTPAQPRTSTSVILGHGFLRDQDNMTGLGQGLANAGIPVVTLDFCNMRPWNGHHQRNASDMKALAEELGRAENVVFAGFSAGALAAVLAADANTRAILTLDLVDQDAMGATAIASLSTPLLGLAGPASACNANANGDAIFQRRDKLAVSTLVRIDRASHCEFESPSNWLCEVTCGDDDSSSVDESDRQRIIENAIDMLEPYLAGFVAPSA